MQQQKTQITKMSTTHGVCDTEKLLIAKTPLRPSMMGIVSAI